MKTFFIHHHSAIDTFCVGLFLYSASAAMLFFITSPFPSDSIRAAIILIIPLCVIRKKFLRGINSKIHGFLRLDR